MTGDNRRLMKREQGVIMATQNLRRVLLLFAALALPSPAVAQDTRPGVAVLPFLQGISIGAEKEVLDALTIGLQQILITELSQNPALRVVDRNILAELMAEQDLAVGGRVDAQTAARIGRLVGAKYVFTGGFNDVNAEFRLDGRIVNTETSEVVKAVEVTDRRDNLFGIVVRLSESITRDLRLPALEATVRQERQSRASAIPREAVILYSQAQFFQDRGQLDRAKELYRRITTEFPRMTEAQEALRRIDAG
jgi:TolB-like protein